MSIKLADTLAPMGDFPAVEADNVDITIDGNPKSLQQAYEDGDLGGGGSVQVETMPAASASNVGKIVQYVGATGTYKKGHFYECIWNRYDTTVYEWRAVDHFRFNHPVYSLNCEPVNSDFIAGDIIYYTGASTDKFKENHFYRALPDATKRAYYQAGFWLTESQATVYYTPVPFELRIGFIFTTSDQLAKPYQLTDINEDGITITPYGWSGDPITYRGVTFPTTVQGWEELEGGGGTSIFYGTMDEWNALSTDAKKQYDYMSDEQNGTDGVYPSAPTTPEIVFDKLNQASNIDATYTVTKKAFHIVRVHCYSEMESHSAQVYLNGVMISNESSYSRTSGVGYTVTIPCNVGDTIRMVVSCGGSGTYDKRSASIYRLN